MLRQGDIVWVRYHGQRRSGLIDYWHGALGAYVVDGLSKPLGRKNETTWATFKPDEILVHRKRMSPPTPIEDD